MLKKLRSKRSVKIIGLLLVVLIGLFGTLYFVFPKFTAISFNKLSSEFAYKFPGEISYKLWSFSVRNDKFRDYLIDNSIPENLLNFSKSNNLANSSDVMTQVLNYAVENNTELNLNVIKVVHEQEFEVLDFNKEDISELNLPTGYEYLIKGQNGKITYELDKLSKSNLDKNDTRLLNRSESDRVLPTSEKKYKGSGKIEDVQKLIGTDFGDIKTAIVTKKLNIDIQEYDSKLFENLEFRNIKIINNTSQLPDLNKESIDIGNVDIYFPTCNFFIGTSINYNYLTKKYSFSNLESIIINSCKGNEIFPETVQVAICEDCTYFPVDKKRKLLNSYKPVELKVVPTFTDISVDSRIYEDLIEMLTEAQAQGFSINIASAYRSYDAQTELFKYWVDREITLYGYDQVKAESEANTFSAKPGFSEHQLGTTIDINSKECEVFDGYCEQNEKFWNWLKLNAHRFGFVQSYPIGKELLTGYIAEAWHYRWLGKEAAALYQSQEGTLTLNQWLETNYSH